MTWTTRHQLVAQQERDHRARQRCESDVGNVWFVGQPINLPATRSVACSTTASGSACGSTPTRVAMKAFNANGSTFKAGDPRVADINGDGKINADDRTIVGDSYPAWTGSLYNRVTWKGFDLSALVTAKWKYTFVDGTPRSYFGRYGNIADTGLLDADESDEQEPGADHGRGRPAVRRRRASTPTARTGAFATSRSATR